MLGVSTDLWSSSGTTSTTSTLVGENGTGALQVNGIYPELDSLSLTELEARFRASPPENPDLANAPPPEDPDLEYADLWYDEVAIAIRERGPDAGARFLREEVAGADPDRLTAILLAISWFHERDRGNADLLIECLEHPDEHVVARAIDGLSWLGGCGLTDRILALIADPRAGVRGAVLRFAARVMPDRAPALLLDALQDSDYHVRSNAVDQLEDLDYTPALARIEALCADPHPHVRQTALSAIPNLGARDQAIPLLLEALRDPHHLVREQAVRELDGLDCTSVLPRIEALCADPEPGVRQAALAAVDKLGTPDKAIPLLLGALVDPNSTVRFIAVNHLGRREQFTDAATFERMLEDPDKDVRECARSILSHLPDSAKSQ